MLFAWLQAAGEGAAEFGESPPEEFNGYALMAIGAMMASFGVLLVRVGVPTRTADGLLHAAPIPARGTYRMFDVLLVAAPFLAMVLLGQIARAQMDEDASSEAALEASTDWGTFLELVAANAFIFGLMASIAIGLALARSGLGGLAVLGLTRLAKQKRPFGRVVTAVVIALVTAPFVLASGWLTVGLVDLLGREMPKQEIATILGGHLREHPFVVIGFAVVLQPILEEILFRGFLLEALRARLGVRLAMVISSIVFALLHGVAFALPLFALAMGLAWVKIRTRSLVLVSLLHMANNTLPMIGLYLAGTE